MKKQLNRTILNIVKNNDTIQLKDTEIAFTKSSIIIANELVEEHLNEPGFYDLAFYDKRADGIYFGIHVSDLPYEPVIFWKGKHNYHAFSKQVIGRYIEYSGDDLDNIAVKELQPAEYFDSFIWICKIK
ncbi:hypothetical protein RJG79_10755 [Mycoplasmatota bacterium WC44]